MVEALKDEIKFAKKDLAEAKKALNAQLVVELGLRQYTNARIVFVSTLYGCVDCMLM